MLLGRILKAHLRHKLETLRAVIRDEGEGG
jgi:hypothetical protein